MVFCVVKGLFSIFGNVTFDWINEKKKWGEEYRSHNNWKRFSLEIKIVQTIKPLPDAMQKERKISHKSMSKAFSAVAYPKAAMGVQCSHMYQFQWQPSQVSTAHFDWFCIAAVHSGRALNAHDCPKPLAFHQKQTLWIISFRTAEPEWIGEMNVEKRHHSPVGIRCGWMCFFSLVSGVLINIRKTAALESFHLRKSCKCSSLP